MTSSYYFVQKSKNKKPSPAFNASHRPTGGNFNRSIRPVGKNNKFINKNSTTRSNFDRSTSRSVGRRPFIQVDLPERWANDPKFATMTPKQKRLAGVYADIRREVNRKRKQIFAEEAAARRAAFKSSFRFKRPSTPHIRFVDGKRREIGDPLWGDLKFGYYHEQNRNAVYRRIMLEKKEKSSIIDPRGLRFRKTVSTEQARAKKDIGARLTPRLREFKRSRFYGREKNAGVMDVRSRDLLFFSRLDFKGKKHPVSVKASWYNDRLLGEVVRKVVRRHPLSDVLGPASDFKNTRSFIKRGNLTSLPDYGFARAFLRRVHSRAKVSALSALWFKVSYRRSRLLGKIARFMKFVPLCDVSASRLSAAAKMLRRGTIRGERALSSGFFERSELGSPYVRRTKKDSAYTEENRILVELQVRQRPKRGTPDEMIAARAVSSAFYAFGRLRRKHLLSAGYSGVFRVAEEFNFIANLFARSFVFFTIRALNRLKSVYRAKFRQFRPSTRAKIYYGIFSRARIMASGAIYEYIFASLRKVNSPFVSAEHFSWLNAVLSNSSSRCFNNVFDKRTFYARSLFKAPLLSRNLFLNSTGSAGEPHLNYGFKNDPMSAFSHFTTWLEKYSSRMRKISDKRSLLAVSRAREFIKFDHTPTSIHYNNYKMMRNSRQAHEIAVLLMENRPFWLLNAARIAEGGILRKSLWDFRLRKIINRDFVVGRAAFAGTPALLSDPRVMKYNPVKFLNYMPRGSKNLRITARVFFSLFALTLKNNLFNSHKSTTLRRNWALFSRGAKGNLSYVTALKYLLGTLSVNYRSILTDVTYTISQAGSVRKYLTTIVDDKRVPAPAAGLRALNEVILKSGGAPVHSSGRASFVNDLLGLWNADVSPKFLNAHVKFLTDGTAARLAFELETLPRRFFYTPDFSKASFTAFNRTNSSAFVKLLSDCCYFLSGSRTRKLIGNNSVLRVISRAAEFSKYSDIVTSLQKKRDAGSFYLSSKSRAGPTFLKLCGADAALARKLSYTFLINNVFFEALTKQYGFSVVSKLFALAVSLWVRRSCDNSGIWLRGSKTRRVESLVRIFNSRDHVSKTQIGHFFKEFNFIIINFKRAFRICLGTLAKYVKRLGWRQENLCLSVGGKSNSSYLDLLRFVASGLAINAVKSLSKNKLFSAKSVFYDNLIPAVDLTVREGRRLWSYLESADERSKLVGTIAKSSVDKVMGRSMKPGFVFMRSFYFSRYVLARRVKDLFYDAFTKGEKFKDAAFTNGNEKLLRKVFGVKKRRLLILKLKPDSRGRSRSFYYLKKKNRLRRMRWRDYKYIRFVNPFAGARSELLGSLPYNANLGKLRAQRSWRRNSFRLKIYQRHFLRKWYGMTTTQLFRRWLSIKQSKRKWLTFFRAHEGRLVCYLKFIKLIPRTVGPKKAIMGGLISVNGVVCLNPSYVVKPGDVILLNNEAYWSITARMIGRLARKWLPPEIPGATQKRLFLDRALKKIRKFYSRGITSAAVQFSLFKSVQDYLTLFAAHPEYRDLPKKPLAPGGAQIGREDLFRADVSRFEYEIDPKYSENRLRFKRRIMRMLRFLNHGLSRNNNRFFYRVHNAVYVIRDPHSAKDFFSGSRRKVTSFYNPRLIKLFMSHNYKR